jgi:hypothetical protein
VTQFDSGQRERAIALLEDVPWGDLDRSIRDMEQALRLALEATTGEFQRWEEDVGPALEAEGYDEFSVPAAMVNELTSEEKLIYVARMLRTLALSYGVSAEFGGGRTGLVGEASAKSPAWVLRGLNDIQMTPLLDRRKLGGEG